MTEHTVYHGGTVYPMTDGSALPAAALLTEGNRVVATGALDDLRELAGANAHEVDLDGAVLLPGFIDSHPHLLHFGSLAEPLVDVLDAENHLDIVERIAGRASRTPKGEWIMTTPVGEPHYFVRRSFHDLAEGTLPDRAVLDRASTDHPVVVQAWAPNLPATLALNSRGLAALGIGRDTPHRMGNVWVERDADGEPTGRLHGSVTNYYADDDFAARLWRQIPFLRDAALASGTRQAARHYHQLGVTAVYENHMMDGKLLDTYRELRQANQLDLRVLCSQEAESYGMPWSRPRRPDDFRDRLERARERIDLDDPYLRFNGITVMWDGVFNVGAMMMKQPYQDPYGEITTGRHQIAPERAEEAMRFCARHGLRLNLMCMGTAAHEEALAVLERLAGEYDLAALNWVLVHAVFIEREQVARYRRFNLDLTTSMSFAWGNGEDFHQRIGADSLRELAPLRWFFDAGFAVAGATDWGPKSVLEQIQLALTHRFASGRDNLGPAQRISRAEAIRMWTTDAARVLRWPQLGSLHPGANADLVMLDRDPFTVPVSQLSTTTVLRTVFDGRVVHDAGVLP